MGRLPKGLLASLLGAKGIATRSKKQKQELELELKLIYKF